MKHMRRTQSGRPAENDTPRTNLLLVVLVLLLAPREWKAGSAGNYAQRMKAAVLVGQQTKRVVLGSAASRSAGAIRWK